jgi:hypothetical protein
MTTILSFLHDTKLTITQWALLTMAATIAILVGIMRLQGSRFHKIQVDLLHQQFGTAMQQQDARVDAAMNRFEAALHLYQESQNE